MQPRSELPSLGLKRLCDLLLGLHLLLDELLEGLVLNEVLVLSQALNVGLQHLFFLGARPCLHDLEYAPGWFRDIKPRILLGQGGIELVEGLCFLLHLWLLDRREQFVKIWQERVLVEIDRAHYLLIGLALRGTVLLNRGASAVVKQSLGIDLEHFVVELNYPSLDSRKVLLSAEIVLLVSIEHLVFINK